MSNPYVKRGPTSVNRGPNRSPNSGPAPRKFNNPLKAWFDKRKEEQKILEDQAVQKITNNIDANTLSLVDELRSVDFIHSGLPSHVLNDRRDEEVLPQICSLEWNTRALIQLIQDDRQNITMDIRPIDEQLMILVKMLKQFVAHGDVMGAKLTMDALYRGVEEIRCKLPVNQPELAEAFVKVNTEHLHQWKTLAEFAQKYDRQGKALDTQKAAAQDAREKKAERLNRFEERLQKEPDFAKIFQEMMANDTGTNRTAWTKLHRDAHAALIEARMQDVEIDMSERKTAAMELELSTLRHQMLGLQTKLNTKPDVSNPNLMNEYNEIMDQFKKELAESDRLMEETIDMMDKLSGAMQQLDESRGHRLAMDTAAEAARKIMEELQERQKQQVGIDELEHAKRLKALGLKTPEQIAAERAAIEKQLEEEKKKAAIKTRPMVGA